MAISSNIHAVAAQETPDGTLFGANADSKIGFFGATPSARPVVPETTPDAQDIIDALVALGLVTQSD